MSNICDDLRKSILRAAITGRLTEQLASDAPVKKVLDANNILYDNEKEYPFDIPENWAWVKLKAVANVQYGFPFNSQLFNKNEKGMPLIRIRDILPAKTSTYTTEKAPENYLIKKNDILVGMDGNFNVNFWSSDDAYLNQRCCKITAGEYLEQKLLYWFLPVFLDEIFENVSYTTVKHLSDKHLTKMSIPLPPLAEQERIVKKVDELMARVADLEQSADALASLKKAFPDDIKASLLQAAMQGKLTEQLPEDGDAEDLLEEIKAEKEKLISEGKIKKQKPLAPITDDEIPFSIPDNWKWVRVGDIFNHNTGKTKNASQNSAGTSRKYITTSNMYWNFFDFTKVGTMSFKDDELEKCTVKKGDLLVCEGGDFGRTAIWNYDEEVCFQNHIHRLRFFKELSHKYFYWLFYFYKSTNLIKGKGIGIQGLSSGALHNIVFPLPPLAEQKRIVDRLEDLMQNINAVEDLIVSE